MSVARHTPVRRWSVVGIVLVATLLLACDGSAKAGKPQLPKDERSLYKPPGYCPANHTCFSNAEWLLWGRKRAVALATGETSYPPGPTATEEIRFNFNAPKHICGGYFYTRARWRYAGDRDYTMSFLLPPACIWSGA
jgi:hypothetical protein